MSGAPTATLNTVLATAKQFINENVPHLETKRNGMFNLIQKKKKREDEAATYMQFPVYSKKRTTQGAINGTTDLLDTRPQQTNTFAQFQWKHDYLTVNLTLDELAKVGNGKNAVIKLASFAIKRGMTDFILRISSNLFLSGYTTRIKELNGLADIFAASGTQYGQLTNTDTNLFDNTSEWLPIIDTTTAAVTPANINIMKGILEDRTQGLVSQDGDAYELDTIVSNSMVYAELQNNSTFPAARFADLTDVKAGIEKFKYNGLDWLIDANSQGTVDGSTADNYLYMLSSAAFHFLYRWGWDGTDSPIDNSDFERLPNQTISMKAKFFSHNMACDNRRVNAVFKALVCGNSTVGAITI
jgi:hypothetical protein